MSGVLEWTGSGRCIEMGREQVQADGVILGVSIDCDLEMRR